MEDVKNRYDEVVRHGLSFVLCLALAILGAGSATAAKDEPVAEGFVAWTGVTEKNHLKGRMLCASDLRHRVAVVVVLESDEKLREQLLLVSKVMPQVYCYAPDSNIEKWRIPREYVGLVSCRGKVTKEALSAALVAPANEAPGVEMAISYAVFHISSVFREASFVGAADPVGKCPYVYVLGPNGGDPIWQGTLTGTVVPQVKSVVEKARQQMDKWETKWRPFFGTVAEPKFFPQLAKTLENGKTAKTCPLDPVAKSILADVTSKDAAKAREAQVLYDAINQTRNELKFRIALEAGKYPHVALVDMAELFKYWPGEKKKLESLVARLKSNSEAELFAKPYAKVRMWSEPGFKCKSAGEAKKIVAEMQKIKKQIAKYRESGDVVIQNAALTMDTKLDALIETIPETVESK